MLGRTLYNRVTMVFHSQTAPKREIMTRMAVGVLYFMKMGESLVPFLSLSMLAKCDLQCMVHFIM